MGEERVDTHLSLATLKDMAVELKYRGHDHIIICRDHTGGADVWMSTDIRVVLALLSVATKRIEEMQDE